MSLVDSESLEYMQAAVAIIFGVYSLSVCIVMVHTNVKLRLLMKKIFLNSDSAVREVARKYFPYHRYRQILEIEKLSKSQNEPSFKTFHQLVARNVLMLRLIIGGVAVVGLLFFLEFYK